MHVRNGKRRKVSEVSDTVPLAALAHEDIANKFAVANLVPRPATSTAEASAASMAGIFGARFIRAGITSNVRSCELQPFGPIVAHGPTNDIR